MNDRYDVVGIGVSVWDRVTTVRRFPSEGDVVQGIKTSENVGGGITVAVATAAKLGCKTAMIDCLGTDPSSDRIVASLQRLGVHTGGVARAAGHTASCASIWASQDVGERTIVYLPGSASERLRWNDRIDSLVRSAQIVHLNGRHLDVCHRAVEVARDAGALISFDGGAHRYREETVPLLRSSDIVIVARDYAERHFQARRDREPVPECGELATFLMDELGCRVVGVTDGARGSHLIAAGESLIFQPAVNVELARDTTGCGDTYHGAFLSAWSRGQTLVEAARIAAEVASQNARVIGALAFSVD